MSITEHRGLGEEADGASQRGAAGQRQRYFLASAVRAERDRRVRRVRLGRPRRPSLPPPGRELGFGQDQRSSARAGRLALPTPAFIPLAGDEGGTAGTIICVTSRNACIQSRSAFPVELSF